MQTDTEKKPVFSELHDELVTKEESIEIRHANLFQNLLLGVSIVLIVFLFKVLICQLDLV